MIPNQKSRWVVRLFAIGLMGLVAALTMPQIQPPAVAQTGGSYDLSWFTIDSSQTITGDTYQLDGSVGQADASTIQSGGQFELSGGFWQVGQQNPTAVTLEAVSTAAAGDLILFVGLFGVLLLGTGAAVWRKIRGQ
ncbi:MAG: hypothetical protein QNJ45_16125 [Ardenticatenaceae bacterium]|nr:hypothetical protein [Ardenticatenaceae bacterium]